MQTRSRAVMPPEVVADGRIVVSGKSRWRVVEILNTSAPHLLLFSAGGVRVVKPYPPNWRYLPDEDLFALTSSVEQLRL